MERLLDYFVPERYELCLKLDKVAKSIDGKVKIYGEVLAETVKFHAVNLEIIKVLVDGVKWDYEVKDGLLVLRKVPRNDSCIEIEYRGKLNENMQGAYLSTYEYDGYTETIVATQFESHYAREAFPCIDEPAAKAVFVLSITTDKDDIVLANTPEASEMPHLGHALGRSAKPMVLDGAFPEAADYKTVYFMPTPRMSTYLLAWVCGKFHGKTVTNAHGVEITTYAALSQDLDAVDFANEVAAKSLEFYDDNFGVPYPLKKLTQVALPDFEAGAMENWGLVTYRETMMLVPSTATLGTKKSVALTVAHELSHQWFGDLVTMKWWDDLWLNESFASVMEYYAVDAIHPEFKIWEGFFTGDALAALKRDCLTGVQPVHQDVNDPAEIATLFDPAIVYAKGARLMLMAIRLVGWEKFTKGLKDYFEEHKYSNAEGADLWRAIQRYADFDLSEMMNGFISQPGYPVVTGDDDYEEFTQKRFLIDGEMTDSHWVLPEIREDMTGHYVLNLSDAEFSERLKRFETLGLEEKLRLLIDRDLLSKTELVKSGSLVPLTRKFINEDSAAVWSIIVAIVAGMKIFFEHESAEEESFKKFVRELVRPKLDEIGIKTRDGDDENMLRLRANLLALAFYAEDMEVLAELSEMYTADYASLDAEIRADILDAKVYLEPGLAREYIRVYEKTADPEVKFDLLFAPTLVKDEKVLEELMELLEKPEVVKPQDQFYLFIWLHRNPVVREKVFEWLTQHWDYVKSLAGDKSLDNYPRYTANTVKTAKDFEKWKKFFLPLASDPALARAIEVGRSEIEARLRLIETDRDSVVMALVEK